MCMICRGDISLFFFQAEDGIRDWSVTGVQTCALPILTMIANDEGQIRDRRVARLLDKEQGVFIALDTDIEDPWYSATVTTGASEKRYGPLYFVSECPQPSEPPRQPESEADTDKPPLQAPAQRRPSWLRRL